jgi:hypothetical protein
MTTTKEATPSSSSFLIELPGNLRHIIMKRAYFLRAMPTRKMFCLQKLGPMAWLEITPKEKSQANAWDICHSIAAKIKGELRQDAYVEPASIAGRHHYLTTPSEAQEDAFDLGNSNNLLNKFNPHSQGRNATIMDPMAALTGSGAGMNLPGFGSGLPGHGMNGIPGMPHIPSIQDFLPANMQGQKQRPKLAFGAIKELPGWDELAENTKLMFEVEAALLAEQASSVMTALGEVSLLFTIATAPNISKKLRAFLERAGIKAQENAEDVA